LNQPESLYFDATPYLRLVIDKDGKWYQNGAEIIHPGVRQQFLDALERIPDGGYRIRLGQEICEVQVEDTPLIVLGIVEDGAGDLILELNDGAQEALDPASFWINDQNIPYSMVRNGQFPARFSRPAYYELAKKIEFNEGSQTFYLSLKGRDWPIRFEKAS